MSTEPTVKVTYTLPADLIEGLRSAVREGAAPSYSAFVTRALHDALKRERERRLAEEFAEAARDAEFLSDQDAVERDFASADAETSRMIP